MELIRGLIRRHIFQIVIHTLILMMSFSFMMISLFLGCELNSFVGILIILFALIFVYMIVSTVFKMQILIDRDVWKSLYKIGILRQEAAKIVRCIDFIFIAFSVPLSIIIGNILIHTYLYSGKKLWIQDAICVCIEIILVGIAYLMQIRFLEERYEKNKEKEPKYVSKKAPLFWKNVVRNQDKMCFIVSIICLGLIACSTIMFICHCDNSESYFENAIAVDYFLTEHDTGSDAIRTEQDVVDWTDIEKIHQLPMFEQGGGLYHNLNEQGCGLITDLLPENSQFQMFYNLEFEKNEAGQYFVNLYGADDFVFGIMDIYEGEIDFEKLKTGDYIIYGLERTPGAVAYQREISEEWKYYKVGDKVTIASEDKTKEYEIMAVCIVNHTYSENNSYVYPGHELVFYLPSEEYLTICKDSPMRYLFDTRNHENIDSELIGLKYESKRGWKEKYFAERDMIINSSILFALSCVAVGGFVYINMLMIAYLDRKKEFEILEKIGMSTYQMIGMILGEGAVYGGMVMIISIAGTILVEAMGYIMMINDSWKFQWDFSAIVISTSIVLIASMIIPVILHKKMTK